MEALAPLIFLLPSFLQIVANYLVDKFKVKNGNWIVFWSFFGFFICVICCYLPEQEVYLPQPGEDLADKPIKCGTGAAIMAFISMAMLVLTILTQAVYLFCHWAFSKD